MELIELYNEIANPLDDPQVIEKLILAYANLSTSWGGYYGGLVRTTLKENKGKYYVEDADKFNSMLFNKWKNNIVAVTRDEFIKLYQQGIYGRDFLMLQKFLMNVSDVSTTKEVDDILNSQQYGYELKNALDKYSWRSLGKESGWNHIASPYLTAQKDEYFNVEHRLYLNIESLDIYKMATYFVEKCDQYHLPYYFKFDNFGDRDDTFVIYSSSENLPKYIELLREIAKEHKDVVARFKEPPILTGKIDNWIGYGSEPSKTPDGKNQSFNDVRANLLRSVIDKVTKEWIMNHLDANVKYQGQNLNFQEFVAMRSTEKLIDDLEKRYLSYELTDKDLAQKNGIHYKKDTTIGQLGYSLENLKNPEFKCAIYRILNERMATSLNIVCNGSFKNMNSIDMFVGNDKRISFSGYDLETIIERLSLVMLECDPNYKETILKEIKMGSIQYGIDSNNFCFDKKRVSEFKKNFLDVQTILDIINPALLQRQMKLPNGMQISAKQYIQEIVFPYLPSNGIIILNDGNILSIKQFIEECVIYECQEQYNGNFPRYMALKTRNNMGQTKIQTSSATFDINVSSIVKSISTTLLKRIIKLPNGEEITGQDYIEQVYAPFIPASGQVTLRNGTEISVIQYIEEVLLTDVLEKYNGDIGLILYNTTKHNKGTIDINPKNIEEELNKLKIQNWSSMLVAVKK